MSSHHLVINIATNTEKRGFEPVGLIYFDWRAMTDISYVLTEHIVKAWMHTDESRLPLNRMLSVCRNLHFQLANERTSATPSFIIEEFGEHCDYSHGAFVLASDTEAYDELCDLADANITLDVTNNYVTNQVFHIYENVEDYQRIQNLETAITPPMVELQSRSRKHSEIDYYPFEEAHRAAALVARLPMVFQIPSGLILEKIVEDK